MRAGRPQPAAGGVHVAGRPAIPLQAEPAEVERQQAPSNDPVHEPPAKAQTVQAQAKLCILGDGPTAPATGRLERVPTDHAERPCQQHRPRHVRMPRVAQEIISKLKRQPLRRSPSPR